MNVMYGIKNCDTIKKARKWLDQNSIDYEFHDYREQGVNPVQLRSWVAESGLKALVNKRSTTWRNLPDETKQTIDANTDQQDAETLALHVMEDQPTLIKRPIVETANGLIVGFNEGSYKKAFSMNP